MILKYPKLIISLYAALFCVAFNLQHSWASFTERPAWPLKVVTEEIAPSTQKAWLVGQNNTKIFTSR